MSRKIDRIKTLGAMLFVIQVVWAAVVGSAMATPSSGSITPQFQQFRQPPDNQTAAVGDKATFKCIVKDKRGVLQWTKNGFGLGTTADDVAGSDGHSMKMSEDGQDVDLEIYPVSLRDDGAIYQCQVGPGPDGNKALRSANAILTVEVPTSPPKIIQGNLIQANEGEEVQLECVSRGGRPAGDITWIDGNGHVIKFGVETIKERLDDCKRFDTRSILRFQASREHHNKMVTCQAYNRPAKQAMSTSIRLEVKYVIGIFIILTCVIGGFVAIATVVLIALLYQRNKKRPVSMEIGDVEKQTKQSDKSLSDSDSKAETGTASFEFVFNTHDEQQVSSALKNEAVCQHADSVDPVFSPKHDGYVPFADFKRGCDFKLPPLTRKTIYNGLATGLHTPTKYLNNSLNRRHPATSFQPSSQRFTAFNSSLPLPQSGGGNTPSNSTDPYGMRNAVSRTSSIPSTLHVVPTKPQVKSRRLETQV